jgi:trk system potassium uptake protein TrkA
MKVLIMGCGRVGALLADLLDKDGHEVTIVDLDAYSFRRLSPDFRGTALVGNGLDEDTLRKAGIEQATAFVAVTQGDNRNIMASQMARQLFNVPRVLCRIYDPLRRDLYAQLGLEAISPTSIFADILHERLLRE